MSTTPLLPLSPAAVALSLPPGTPVAAPPPLPPSANAGVTKTNDRASPTGIAILVLQEADRMASWLTCGRRFPS
ncbi:hypothetical protein [Labrenzia sp. R5_0]|uniref:hypothetical protein n=1 Tax=Labrenzia sp. R5_0 TaxID=2821108 RepID=UPI001ADA1BFE|nr:hypothetical protein [Labrenzia sp. R5_0]MBO9462243.1 hypothetical protein [Labrenzia sp. R5_0]